MRAYSRLKVTAFIISTFASVNGFAQSGESGFPDVNEPMVFDLVRSLNSPAGALEANTLVQIPIDDPLVVNWAPEVEYSYMDGGAIELEFGFENEDLHALKLGLQNTVAAHGSTAHAIQFIGEYDPTDEVWESALLWVPEHQFNAHWSVIAILGPGLEAGHGETNHGFHSNVTVFWTADGDWVIGSEQNVTYFVDEPLLVRWMPQLHLELGKHVEWQLGLGVLALGEPVQPEASTRLIAEF